MSFQIPRLVDYRVRIAGKVSFNRRQSNKKALGNFGGMDPPEWRGMLFRRADRPKALALHHRIASLGFVERIERGIFFTQAYLQNLELTY